MPAIARPWRRWRSRRAIAGPNFGAAVAQGEAEIEPDRVLHDLGRKAMAAVAERSHADMLSDTPPLPTRLPDKAASIDLACTTVDSADAHAQPASRHLRNMALVGQFFICGSPAITVSWVGARLNGSQVCVAPSIIVAITL